VSHARNLATTAVRVAGWDVADDGPRRTLGGGVCRDDDEPDRRYGPDVIDFCGLALQGVRGKMPEQVPGPREAAGENKLSIMALDVQTFNGSLLEVRGMMLMRVIPDDIVTIAVARHLGMFKPNSSVPCEFDVYLFKNLYILCNDVFEFLNHKSHKLVVIRIARPASSRPCSGPRPVSSSSGLRLSIRGLHATAYLLGRPRKRTSVSVQHSHDSSGRQM
jgi:hypothetical protein